MQRTTVMRNGNSATSGESSEDEAPATTEKERTIPKMSLSELEVGRFLGRGGFSIVKEISAINLSKSDERERHSSVEIVERSRMASHVRLNGEARFAIKRIIPSLDEEKMLAALHCHFQEVNMLRLVSHKSIIKMRAESNDQDHSDLFIVLDRLYLTLEQHIARVWKVQKRRYSLLPFCFGNGKKRREMWKKQLIVGFDIASAMEYLHEHNIIHRDLKPDNIGFDGKGECKLFDFGLARHLPTQKKVGDGTYNLTGYCGELPYMAPEVARRERYNEKADVWSFAMVFWEVCAANAAFPQYTPQLIEKYVIDKGYRPAIEKSWDRKLATLFQLAWSRNIEMRPSFEAIVETLGDVSIEAGGDILFVDDSFSRSGERAFKSGVCGTKGVKP